MLDSDPEPKWFAYPDEIPEYLRRIKLTADKQPPVYIDTEASWLTPRRHADVVVTSILDGTQNIQLDFQPDTSASVRKFFTKWQLAVQGDAMWAREVGRKWAGRNWRRLKREKRKWRQSLLAG